MVNSKGFFLATVLVALGLAALAGCGGAGRALPYGANAQGPLRSVKAIVVVKFPRRAKRQRHRARRGPRYVSADTASVTFTLTKVNGGSVPAGFTASMTVSLTYQGNSTKCTYSSSAKTYTCTTSWLVPAASDTFTVDAYDSSSNLLSTNALTQTVATGSSTIAVTLWGVPASLTIVTSNTSVLGSATVGFLLPVSATSYPFTVQARDTDGDAIVGPGAPSYSVSLSSTTDFSVQTPAPNATGFTVTELAAKAFVGTSLTAAVVYPSTGSTPYPQACPSTSCSTTSWVSTGGPLYIENGNSHTISAYSTSTLTSALGGTSGSAAGTLATGRNPQALAFDAAGDLFIANGSSSGGDNTIGVYSATEASKPLTGGTGSVTGTLSTGSDPAALAFDASGDLFVANYSAGTISAYTAAKISQALGGSTVSSSGTLATGSQPIAMAFDSAGDLCVVNASSATATVYKPSKLAAALGGSTNVAASGSLATGSAPWHLAFDASGDLFVSNSSANTISTYSASTVASALGGSTSVAADGSLTTGTFPHDVAVNSSGDLFVANYTSSTVSAYSTSAVANALGGSTSVAASGSLTTGSNPQALAFDASGDLFVTNDGAGTASVYKKSAVTSAIGGSTGVAATSTLTAQNGPLALAFAP